MKENNLFERLLFLQTKYLIELNKICLIQTKYLLVKKYLFKSNKFFFKTNELLHSFMVKDIIRMI